MTITEHDAGLRAFPVVERRTLAKDDGVRIQATPRAVHSARQAQPFGELRQPSAN